MQKWCTRKSVPGIECWPRVRECGWLLRRARRAVKVSCRVVKCRVVKCRVSRRATGRRREGKAEDADRADNSEKCGDDGQKGPCQSGRRTRGAEDEPRTEAGRPRAPKPRQLTSQPPRIESSRQALTDQSRATGTAKNTASESEYRARQRAQCGGKRQHPHPQPRAGTRQAAASAAEPCRRRRRQAQAALRHCSRARARTVSRRAHRATLASNSGLQASAGDAKAESVQALQLNARQPATAPTARGSGGRECKPGTDRSAAARNGFCQHVAVHSRCHQQALRRARGGPSHKPTAAASAHLLSQAAVRPLGG